MAALAGGCNPYSRRPLLLPYPEALRQEVEFTISTATIRLSDALAEQRIPLSKVYPRDGWLESPWFEAATGRPAAGPALSDSIVRLRLWVEPARPRHSLVTIEVVYVDRIDPSRSERELEQPVPKGNPALERARGVLADFAGRKGIKATR